MALAARRMTDVKNKEWKADYGRLCHNFPVMVLTCGLCQAVAFSLAKRDDPKGNKNRREAHKALIEHVEAIAGAPVEEIWSGSTLDYILYTRRVLAAWIYYKRFAVSILGVEDGHENKEARLSDDETAPGKDAPGRSGGNRQ